jgi:hypothetical protein
VLSKSITKFNKVSGSETSSNVVAMAPISGVVFCFCAGCCCIDVGAVRFLEASGCGGGGGGGGDTAGAHDTIGSHIVCLEFLLYK